MVKMFWRLYPRAASLRSIRRGISEISNTISGCHLTTRVGRGLYGAELKLRDVKSELEAVMFRDHPEEASLDVYYGSGRD
jgi:hypothetical protein